MFNFNIHIFAISATIIFYIILKNYSENVKKQDEKTSRLIYVIYIPMVIYLTKYICKPVESIIVNNTTSSLSDTFPASALSNFH